MYKHQVFKTNFRKHFHLTLLNMFRPTTTLQEMPTIVALKRKKKPSDRAVRNCGQTFWNLLHSVIKR